jgi:negative regulator of flagellin synthesis FlgM
MAIDITGSTTAHTANAYEGSPVQTTRTGTDATAQGGAGTESGSLDTVNLTGTGTLMQQLDAAIAATPVVDMARVNRIQQAIENGTYEIDPMRVAEKMLSFETALQSRGL